MPSDSLSLYDIESGLVEVLAAREEASTPEEIAAADGAIAAYVQAEIAKVDRIAAYLRHCKAMQAEAKAEAARLTARAAAWDERRKRLLNFVQNCMEMTGKRRIEGSTNTLALKGNGGKQRVIVDDLSLVPLEFCVFRGTISGTAWIDLLALLRYTAVRWDRRADVQMVKDPSLGVIGERLDRGESIAGCRLEPRGEHVEVK